MKILELFGGIGACSKALERLGIDYEIADYVEIDKYAVKSFNAIHNTNFEPQDICEWDKDIEVDLIMHGSPCQDFSLAGKQAGGDKDSGTRSSLMYETIRIVEKLKPKYVIWENVKNLLSKKHIHNFNAYLETMEQLGYTNYYQVLNAKDYGIPQNRERVFTISILGNEKYEFPKENIQECEVINPLKDISGKSWQFEQNVYSENSILRSLKAGGGSGNIPKVIEHFEFPAKQELKLRLKDMLEDEVDEKYMISDKLMVYYERKIKQGWRKELHTDDKEISSTICNPARNNINDTFVRCQQVGTLDIKGQDIIKRVYSEEGLCPTLTNMQGGNRQPKVIGGVGEKKSNGGTQWYQQDRIYDNNIGLSISTTAQPYYPDKQLRIRKLTPKECWRLQGFDDKDFEAAEKVNSNTQLYKQAGNSIVVNVLEAILTNLLLEKQEDKGQYTIFDYL